MSFSVDNLIVECDFLRQTYLELKENHKGKKLNDVILPTYVLPYQRRLENMAATLLNRGDMETFQGLMKQSFTTPKVGKFIGPPKGVSAFLEAATALYKSCYEFAEQNKVADSDRLRVGRALGNIFKR